ncbi:hypothetical protein POUND7_015682 [Theobroma cacao]
MAELLAVREAFLLFATSTRVSSHNLIIESNSMKVVKWIRDPLTVLWCFHNITFQIKSISSRVINWEIIHLPRFGNCIANCLAKEVVGRA